ncbi:unnamed protein product [Paramecium primaurelia]|uniref:DUF8019 domain-containing protein n=1 Tax=Paramecium primaurelia TaxID=5886 RepID=A0A8S1Q9P4_PARPR|nr:unnamed protein product [Paramecium primaurelia]
MFFIFYVFFLVVKSQDELAEGEEMESDCDMEFDMPFCSGNGTPMQENSFLNTLKILLSFNDMKVVNKIDQSEYEVEELERGPTLYDDGYSGVFKGSQILEMPQNEQTPYFTYSMWLFFPRTSGAERPRSVCPIFQKGNEETHYPSLYYDQKHKQFIVYIDQTVTSENTGLVSVSRPLANQWIYVSLVSTSSKLKLYINGVLDNIKIFQAAPKPNDYALYVGNTPWFKDYCSMMFLLDKFQYYTEEIKAYFIQAQAQFQLESASIHFGCISCNIEEASGACISGYHLCTKIEFYSGVYNVARQLGWMDYGDFVWTYQDAIRKNDKKKGLAVCCIDSF